MQKNAPRQNSVGDGGRAIHSAEGHSPSVQSHPSDQEARDETSGGTGGLSEFLWNVHSYTNEYIRFADAKAGVVITLASALIGALFTADLHHAFMRFPVPQWRFTGWGACLAFLSLVAAIAASGWAVRPRLWTKQKPGVIFWESIVAHRSSDAFWGNLRLTDDLARTEHVARHIYDLGGVCRAKYRLAAIGLWLAILGGVLAALVMLSK